MKCGHKGIHRTLYRDAGIFGMFYRPCEQCGEWLPLGPSNDASEAVRVEIEAARCALHRIHNDWPDDEPEDEWANYGWAAYELDCDVYDGTWHGWLANHIVYEHEALP